MEKVQDYRALLENVLKEADFIKVYRALLHVMDLDEVVVFCYLKYHRDGLKQHLRRLDGYLYCTASKMQTGTGLVLKKQTRAIKKLMVRELIETKHEGWPPKRWIKINEDVFHSILQTGFRRIDKLEKAIAEAKELSKNKKKFSENNWESEQ